MKFSSRFARNWISEKGPDGILLCIVFLLGIGGVGVFPMSVGGEEAPLSRFTTLEGDQTLSIAAERMLIRNQENRILFEGNVTMERNGLLLKAGEVEIVFAVREGQGGSLVEGTQDRREIDTITARIGVKLTKGEQTILSRQVVYFRKDEKMVFTGDPMVRERNNEVRGGKITVFLKDDRALVEGGTAVIHPR